MAKFYDDAMSDGIIVQFARTELVDSRDIMATVRLQIIETLAQEFIKQHKDNILKSIHVSDVAYELTGAIVKCLETKLNGEK